MNKLFSSLFLATFLLAGGLVHAAAIPQSEDPRNGPGVWLVPVYNNSAVTLQSGDVVVWDIGSSTGDVSNWVTTTTTADTAIVAGVVYRSSIAVGDTGSIAIRGSVPVNMSKGGQAVNGPVCSSATATKANNCGNDDQAFGIVVGAVSSGVAQVYVNR